MNSSAGSQRLSLGNLIKFQERRISSGSIGSSFYGKLLWFDERTFTAYLNDGGSHLALKVKPFHARYFPPDLYGRSIRVQNLGFMKSATSNHSYFKIRVEEHDHFNL